MEVHLEDRTAVALVEAAQEIMLVVAAVDTVAEMRAQIQWQTVKAAAEAGRTTSTAPRSQPRSTARGTRQCTGPCRRISRAATPLATDLSSSACVLRRRTWFREHAPSAPPMLTALETEIMPPAQRAHLASTQQVRALHRQIPSAPFVQLEVRVPILRPARLLLVQPTPTRQQGQLRAQRAQPTQAPLPDPAHARSTYAQQAPPP